MSATPRQARELAALRSLAKELLERATRLEHDLVDALTDEEIRMTAEPRPEDYAAMARLRRRRGLAR